MKKPLPKFDTDEVAEAFVDQADLTEFDLTGLSQMRFEFQPKSRSVTMRLPEQLFKAIKEKAANSGMPYQRFIRKILEDAMVLRK